MTAVPNMTYTAGRESSDTYNESLAGVRVVSGTNTDAWLMVDALDVMFWKPLPHLTVKRSGPMWSADGNLMAYSYRVCITDDSGNSAPFPKPDDYDQMEFELLRRYIRRASEFNETLRLPCQRIEDREEDNRGTAQTLRAGTHVVHGHQPPEVRRNLSRFGLCKDEWPDNSNFSTQLYVREPP